MNGHASISGFEAVRVRLQKVFNMPERSPVVPTLELISKTIPSRMYELEAGRLRIGRDVASDICLDDKRVSSSHAQIIRRSGGAFFVEDLKSYNSTYLDGRVLPPFSPAPLKDGSRIRICDFSFIFHKQAVELREGESDDQTILETLEDMSSGSLASRAERSAAVLHAVLEINRILGGATELNQVLGRARRTLRDLPAGRLRLHPDQRARREVQPPGDPPQG